MDIQRIYREESGRILATLIRLLGSFDLAEEALQDAFAVALEQWPKTGLPANPRAWLISTARNKGIDRFRRQARLDGQRDELQRIATLQQEFSAAEEAMPGHDGVEDDRLRLIFTCCHPALPREGQVALTLRTLCGLSTEEIARAFLVPLPTMSQRLVRAKQKIRDAQIPYRVPPERELAGRLESVMLVVYLVFNEGYNASSGDMVIRHDLCAEAIRLERLICELLPGQSEALALLALMLLHNSRRAARVDAAGEMILLEEQDRSRWNEEEIREGLGLVETVLRPAPGTYGVQAAIAAVHARAKRPEDTEWRRIAGLYQLLLQLQPSPVVELNHAAAIAMCDGPEAGLTLLDALEQRGELQEYYLLPAAQGDLLRRLGRWSEAARAYRRALALSGSDAARRFLSRRLAEAESEVG